MFLPKQQNECAVCGEELVNELVHKCKGCNRIICEQCFKVRDLCFDCWYIEKVKERNCYNLPIGNDNATTDNSTKD